MYLKEFRNLFLCAQKLKHPFLKFYFINPRNCSVNFLRQITSPSIRDSPEPINEQTIKPKYFHEYLLRNKEKYDVCSIADLNFEEETKVSLKLLNDFINNSKETLEHQEIPQELEATIKREIHEYNLDEICKYIVLTSKSSFSSTSKLSEYLDILTVNKTLPLKDSLKILYFMTTYREKKFYSKLFWRTLYKLCRKVKALTPQQVKVDHKVLFCFCLRKVDPECTKNIKFKLIESLIETVPTLNSDELGIIARGFIKSSIKLSDGKLIEEIVNKTITEKQNFSNSSLIVVLQMVAKNLKLQNIKDVNNLQEEFIPLIPTLTNSAILSLAAVGCFFNFVNLSFWEVIQKHFKENFDSCTNLNVIRLVQLSTIFGPYENELFQKAIKKVEDQNNLKTNLLISFLSHLVLHQLYPEKLLEKVLSKDFRLSEGKKLEFTTKYQYAFLHLCVELELPTNNFILMDESEKRHYYKALAHAKFNKNKSLLWYFATLEAEKIIIEEYGENSVIKMACIPYGDIGLVMRFDKSLKAQLIPQEFKQFDKLFCNEAFKDDHLWIFIKILNIQSYLYCSNELSLKNQVYMRHIKLLGYTPIFIKDKDWKNGTMRESLLDAIQKSLQNTVEDVHNK